MRKRNFTSLEVPAKIKCGCGPSHLWKSWSNKCGSGTRDLSKSWQNSGSESRISHLCQSREFGLAIYSRALAKKPNQIFESQGRADVRKRNSTSLEVPAKIKCGSGPSHLWKSWSNKCGSGTRDLSKSWQNSGSESRISHICQSRESGSVEAKLQKSLQSRSAEAEFHIFGSQGRTEVQKRNFTPSEELAEQKCGMEFVSHHG